MLVEEVVARENHHASSPSYKQLGQSAPENMIVLEATSDEAATMLVLGMKWMIARLAFNLIVGNTSISCELYRPDQPAEDRGASAGADEDSMGPCRPPIVRKTTVMNDITFHMLGKAAEKAKQYQLEQQQQQQAMFPLQNEFRKVQ